MPSEFNGCVKPANPTIYNELILAVSYYAFLSLFT